MMRAPQGEAPAPSPPDAKAARQAREQARAAALRAWLLSQRRTKAAAGEAADTQRRRFAYRTFFGWLPVAIVVYWIAFILTRYVIFTSNADIPEYYFMATGPANTQPNAMYYEERGAQLFKIDRTKDMRTLRVSDPASGSDSCSSADYNGDHRVAINPTAVQLLQDPDVVSKRYLEVSVAGLPEGGTIVCRVAWPAHAESFASSEFELHNGWPGSRAHQSIETVVLNLSWYGETNEVEMFSVSAKRGVDDMERVLEPDSGAVVRSTSPERSAWRDIIFIVIGALIALGAAILLEALRHNIDLSIQHAAAGPHKGGPQ